MARAPLGTTTSTLQASSRDCPHALLLAGFLSAGVEPLAFIGPCNYQPMDGPGMHLRSGDHLHNGNCVGYSMSRIFSLHYGSILFGGVSDWFFGVLLSPAIGVLGKAGYVSAVLHIVASTNHERSTARRSHTSSCRLCCRPSTRRSAHIPWSTMAAILLDCRLYRQIHATRVFHATDESAPGFAIFFGRSL